MRSAANSARVDNTAARWNTQSTSNSTSIRSSSLPSVTDPVNSRMTSAARYLASSVCPSRSEVSDCSIVPFDAVPLLGGHASGLLERLLKRDTQYVGETLESV